MWNKNVGVEVKKVIFGAMVRSKLMYGGEVWWAGKQQMGKLETVQNDFVRWISGHTRKDRWHVQALRQEVEMSSVENELCSRRLQWLGACDKNGCR